VPTEALATIRHKAAFEVERILEIEAEVGHNVIAFLTNAKRKTIVERCLVRPKKREGCGGFYCVA
jgi:adenylosuccinate lyase